MAVVTAGDSAAVHFTEVAVSMAADSAGVHFAAAALTALDFAAMDFTEIGFTMATSTIGFSSLMTSETRSFTIPIHITGIILTDTDTGPTGA